MKRNGPVNPLSVPNTVMFTQGCIPRGLQGDERERGGKIIKSFKKAWSSRNIIFIGEVRRNRFYETVQKAKLNKILADRK